jgi:hypothetical protein
MSRLIRYRLRLKVTLSCNIRVVEKLALVMRSQSCIYNTELEESNDAAAVRDLTAKGAAAFVFQALAVVRGVGCDNKVNGDDDNNSPGSGAGLGAVMTAEARRPRAAVLAAIVLPLNGLKPALLHASFSQFAPSSDAAVFFFAFCSLLALRLSLNLVRFVLWWHPFL